MVWRLLLALGLAVVVGCSPRAKQTSTPAAPVGQQILLTDSLLRVGGSDTVRLGRLGSGEQALVRLNLCNRTQQPLVVLGHELTCGCIRLDYENRPIPAGGYLPVEMQFDSRGLYGWQLKLFYLQLHGAAQPWRVYVEAELE